MSNTKKSNEEMDGKKNDTELAGDDETPSPETAVVTSTSTPTPTAITNPPQLEEEPTKDQGKKEKKNNKNKKKNPALEPMKYNGIPEEKAWFISRLFYVWERPLFRRANQLGRLGEPLQQDDLLPLPSIDRSKGIGNIFETNWNRLGDYYANSATANTDSSGGGNGDGDDAVVVKGLQDVKDNANVSTAQLRWTLLRVLGKRFIVAGIVKFINTALQFSFPLLLNAILKYLEDLGSGTINRSDSYGVQYRGYWLSFLLFFAMAAKAVTENLYFFMVYRAGYQARVAVSVAVYNKSLRLTNTERQSTTLGMYPSMRHATFEMRL